MKDGNKNTFMAFGQLILVKSDEVLQFVHRAADIGEPTTEMIMGTHAGKSGSEIYAAVINRLFLNAADVFFPFGRLLAK